ncbi:opsin-5-like isoform X2 [Danaus plexippus]|nr:opsin-5-like isoform X2 [Danaus plexippus]
MVAVFFAIPPLFGYGLYSCDATGTVCTFLWPSLNSGAKQLGFSVPYVIVCGVLPIVGIFYYMGKAIRLEKIYYRNEQQREERRLTKCIHIICVTTLALWIPAAILAGWQWLPLLMFGYRPHVPQVLAVIAPVATEAATSVPVLCYLSADERVRASLLGRMRKQYALLHPERAKLYKRSLY